MPEEKPEGEKTRLVVQLTKGTSVGHYVIVEKIGAGGMGEVYLADDTELNRKVALKFLPLHLCQDTDCRTRFKREAQAAAKLNHPNIVTIHEVSEFNGRPFFAMEHVEGQSLRELIKAKELPTERVIELAIQICEGLHKAHLSGIVHRDVKPANILIDTDGRAKILDFGLASVAGTDHLTKTGSTLGTIGYMSPEQVRGEQVDHRSDIFSLGVVLYELVTGKQPFRGDNDTATSRNIIDHEPEPLARYKSGVDVELQRIISKALQKNRALRYQHTDELSADLKSVRSTSETSAATRALSRSNLSKRKWAYFAAGLAILVVAFFLIKAYVLKPADEPLDSLAVLPLQNLSGDPEQEYFSDGMTEALITELQRIKALRVISRTSVMRFKKTNESLPDIAKRLTVKAIVEGSVMRDGDRVRITVQLIQASPEKHLWAGNFDRPMQNVLSLQSDVAQAIAREVRAVVSPEENLRMRSHAPVNPLAYQAYLKGRFYWNKRRAEDLRTAIQYFNQAIEIDSNYALAYAGLGAAYAILPEYAYLPSKEYLSKAEAAAMKALAIDSTLGEAYAVLGGIKNVQWDWAGAEHEFRIAIKLNPSYPTLHHWYSILMRTQRRFDEALAESKVAQELDPLSLVIMVNLGTILYEMKQYDKAIDVFEKTLELDPGFPMIHGELGCIHQRRGNYDGAIKEYQKEISIGDSSSSFLSNLGQAYALSGNTSEAHKILDVLLRFSRQGESRSCDIAFVYYGLGDTGKTFEWLERAYQERENNLTYLNEEPLWDGLRSDPRFKELIEKMGLEK